MEEAVIGTDAFNGLPDLCKVRVLESLASRTDLINMSLTCKRLQRLCTSQPFEKVKWQSEALDIYRTKCGFVMQCVIKEDSCMFNERPVRVYKTRRITNPDGARIWTTRKYTQKREKYSPPQYSMDAENYRARAMPEHFRLEVEKFLRFFEVDSLRIYNIAYPYFRHHLCPLFTRRSNLREIVFYQIFEGACMSLYVVHKERHDEDVNVLTKWLSEMGVESIRMEWFSRLPLLDIRMLTDTRLTSIDGMIESESRRFDASIDVPALLGRMTHVDASQFYISERTFAQVVMTVLRRPARGRCRLDMRVEDFHFEDDVPLWDNLQEWQARLFIEVDLTEEAVRESQFSIYLCASYNNTRLTNLAGEEYRTTVTHLLFMNYYPYPVPEQPVNQGGPNARTSYTSPLLYRK